LWRDFSDWIRALAYSSSNVPANSCRPLTVN